MVNLGACGYTLPSGVVPQADLNPAENYSHLLTSCKIAYGMGMCVVTAGLCTVLAVTLRRDVAHTPGEIYDKDCAV